MTKADLIKTMRLAHMETDWKSPISGKDFSSETGYRIYRKPRGTDDRQYTLRGEVTGSTHEFNDHGFSSTADAQSYEYAVTSVDDEGNESMFSGSLSGISSNGTAQAAVRSARSARK